MRTFLLSLCAAALLAGCSDDETSKQAPAVVGDAQFAAAIDEFPTETRAALADGVTTWTSGDCIGITAMIDGTPFIRNIPYTLTSTATFSELEPVDEAILWNESVTGERSYFAIWPYDPVNDEFTALNCAQFIYQVPAVQQVVKGVNTAKPVLVGTAATTALTQRPVALRFTHLFPVLDLRFAPFDQTAIASILIEPAEQATLTGSLSTEGVIDNLGNMTKVFAGEWIRVECKDEGLDIAQGAAIQIPIGRFTIDGGLKFTAMTTDGRVFSETAFAGEAWTSYMADAEGNFSKAKYLKHTMALEVVSDETTEVYFEDDLNWITASERWTNGSTTGGGWPTVTAAASPTGKPNYFTVDLIPEFTARGYEKSDQRTSVQARYEGYICLGTTSAQGALITPRLERIGSEPTDILVSFYGASYASENLVPDAKPLTVKVVGDGTIGEEQATETDIRILNCYGWKKYWIIVKGATSGTQICFGPDVKQSRGRVLLDNILIGKAVKGAVAGEREVSVPVEPFIRVIEGADGVVLENAVEAEGRCIVQSNLPWTASTDADWISYAPEAEFNGTGIAYAVTVQAKTLNETGRERTAEITFAVGENTKTVRFTQSGVVPEVVLFEDDFSWCDGDGTTGGIFDATLSDKTSIGSGGKTYTKWTDAYKAKGWTASLLTNSPTTRNGTLLVGGTTTAAGDVISPAFAEIGSGTRDVVVEYDVLEYKNASETGKSIIAIYAGGGTIRSIEGHYTATPNDTYTSLSDDGRTQYYYCGNYTNWSGGNARWHRIRVVIAGATAETKVQLAGGAKGYSRFWLDNFKVTPVH